MKWKNWGDEDTSWVSRENLEGCQELVQDFEDRLMARGDRHKGKARGRCEGGIATRASHGIGGSDLWSRRKRSCASVYVFALYSCVG